MTYPTGATPLGNPWDSTQPARFVCAVDNYVGAMKRYRAAREAELFHRDELEYLRRDLKLIEWRVISGTGEMIITGKNAEERAASLGLILAELPEYQTGWERVRQAERAMAQEALEASLAIDQMSLEKRTMDYEVAVRRSEEER
jgi:hypothetical protein